MFVDIKVKCFKEFFDVYVSFVYGLADRDDTPSVSGPTRDGKECAVHRRHSACFLVLPSSKVKISVLGQSD